MADVMNQNSKSNGPLSPRAIVAESGLHRPARPLLGVLPVARVIPQDVHSVMDYMSGATGIGTMFLSEQLSSKLAGSVIGATIIGASLLTDYRLSVAKVIPIE